MVSIEKITNPVSTISGETESTGAIDTHSSFK